jgi:hypothetical protein
MPVVELSITDDSQLGSLESFLRRELPEVAVGRQQGSVEHDTLGWEDVLTLTFVSISALADAIELIRSYLELRVEKTGATITATAATQGQTKKLSVRGATQADVKEFVDWFTHG